MPHAFQQQRACWWGAGHQSRPVQVFCMQCILCAACPRCSQTSHIRALLFMHACFNQERRVCHAKVPQQRADPHMQAGEHGQHTTMDGSSGQAPAGARRACPNEEGRVGHADAPQRRAEQHVQAGAHRQHLLPTRYSRSKISPCHVSLAWFLAACCLHNCSQATCGSGCWWLTRFPGRSRGAASQAAVHY